MDTRRKQKEIVRATNVDPEVRMSTKAVISFVLSAVAGIAIAYAAISRASWLNDYMDSGPKYPRNDTGIEAMFLGDSEAMQYFKRWFYDDYKAGLRKFKIKISTRPSETEISEYQFQLGVEWRRKAADPASRAPDEYLVSLYDDYIAIFETVKAAAGSEECATLAQTGTTELSKHHGPTLKVMDRQHLGMLKAWRFGLKDPVDRSPANDADWQTISDNMTSGGLPQSYFDLVWNANTDHPDYCDALLGYFAAIKNAKGESGERIRAEIVRRMLSS